MRIGFFDSGIGGLSVLRHALQDLPGSEFLYVADSAFAPYGEQDEDWVRERSLYIASHLESEGVDALVIACNTATALAAEPIREHLAVPVIAMEPAIKPAVMTTRSGMIGVLATATTLASQRYHDLRQRYAHNVELLEYAPHHWVKRIEQGRHQEPAFEASLKQELFGLVERGVDTWVLACTHFPFIHMQLANAVGTEAKIIDPAEAVTAQLLRRLRLPPVPNGREPVVHLLTSGELDRVSEQASRFLYRNLSAQPFS